MKTDNKLELLEIQVGELVTSESEFQVLRRSRRSVEMVAELAASIGVHGVLEPLIVRYMAVGHFEIVVGEGRYLGAVEAGLEVVPCLVRVLDDGEVLEIQMTENFQRHDVGPLEEAVAYGALADMGWSQERIAGRMGFSQGRVCEVMRLRELEGDCRLAVLEGKLGVKVANALLKVDVDLRDEALRAVLEPDETEGALRQVDALRVLRVQYLNPAEDRWQWEDERGRLEVSFPGCEVLSYNDCAGCWDVGQSVPRYDSRWRLAGEILPGGVIADNKLEVDTTWGGAAGELGLPRLVARDGAGAAVLVVERVLVLGGLKNLQAELSAMNGDDEAGLARSAPLPGDPDDVAMMVVERRILALVERVGSTPAAGWAMEDGVRGKLLREAVLGSVSEEWRDEAEGATRPEVAAAVLVGIYLWDVKEMSDGGIGEVDPVLTEFEAGFGVAKGRTAYPLEGVKVEYGEGGDE